MKRIGKFVALSTLSAVLCTGAVFAQDDHRDNGNANASQHDNHTYVRHNDWKKGHAMNHDDWARGEPVDYRTYHLRQPQRGYEWRQVDGNYVLAAVATGIIASTIIASSHH